MHDTIVARQLVREHENRLRRLNASTGLDGRHHVRHWIGHTLVRTGTWLLDRTPIRAAPAVR